MTVKAGADDPLIVATGTDMAIFPGGGQPPKVQSFRLSTRGFKELAGIAHFGTGARFHREHACARTGQ
jgi:hypothetical protein